MKEVKWQTINIPDSDEKVYFKIAQLAFINKRNKFDYKLYKVNKINSYPVNKRTETYYLNK